MIVFDTLIPVLIFAGFLCVTVIQGNLEADFERLFSEKCVTNAGPEARDLYQNSMIYAQILCVHSSKEDAMQLRGRDGIFEFYCSKIPTVQKCTKYATNFIRPCFTLEEQESADIIYKMIISLVDFFCQHEDFSSAVLNNDEKCLLSNEKALQNCVEEILSSYASQSDISSVKDPAAGLKSRFEKPWIVGVEDCLNVKKFQSCTVQVLEGCENRTIAKLVESMINSTANAVPCENLLKAHAAPSTELIPSPVEQLESLMQKKCEKNGNSTSSDTAIDGLRSFSNCLTMLVNVTQFKAEVINAAALTGELDILFDNYSRKVPIFSQCVEHLNDSIESCLVPEDREAVNIINNITGSWLKNIFHGKGDRDATHKNLSSSTIV